VADHALHHQKRAARVRVEEPLPALWAGVKKRAAVGCARGVHQAVDAPETLQSRGDEAITVLWNREMPPKPATPRPALSDTRIHRHALPPEHYDP
jgi:hypothetical protein